MNARERDRPNGHAWTSAPAMPLDRQARLAAEATRIALRAYGTMARCQAEALDAMGAELERGETAGAPDPFAHLALPAAWLRLTTEALLAQSRAALDAAAAVQAAAVAAARADPPADGAEP